MKYPLIFLLACSTFVSHQSNAQDSLTQYRQFIHKADSLFNTKLFIVSGRTFDSAFNIFGGKGYPDDRYYAALAWALAKNRDSAFYNLERIAVVTHYAKYFELKNEEDFGYLHPDKRWKILLDTVKQNQLNSYANYNVPLCELLDSMYEVDQRCRNKTDRFINHHNFADSVLDLQLWSEVKKVDKYNYTILDSFFKHYGYIGYNLAGTSGENHFWLLIQHQDKHPGFQDSVLVRMKIEVERNNANKINFAYLTDRVKLNTGQLQVYGTQMIVNDESNSFVPRPCIDLDKLNERRKSVGLSTIEEYTKTMNTNHSGMLHNKKQ